ncbi:hypothetical protein [Stenotrophomonas acidaminiphila]|uniref:hypothetical protein n=1 Tax=Stenotrophomonas acidaminiphila TaxID=128780 RepID=UPI0039BCE0BB
MRSRLLRLLATGQCLLASACATPAAREPVAELGPGIALPPPAPGSAALVQPLPVAAY